MFLFSFLYEKNQPWSPAPLTTFVDKEHTSFEAADPKMTMSCRTQLHTSVRQCVHIHLSIHPPPHRPPPSLKRFGRSHQALASKSQRGLGGSQEDLRGVISVPEGLQGTSGGPQGALRGFIVPKKAKEEAIRRIGEVL